VEAALRIVLYFDVFRHPLTHDELQSLAGGIAPPDPRIERHGRYVCRAGRGGDIAARIERTNASEQLWPKAVRMGRWMGRLPWVRAVFLTGSLSKRSAEPDADFDFLLLVEHGHVWSAKTVIELIRRGLPQAGREAMCANYLRDRTQPILDDHTVFTAMELATAVPLHGDCAPFIEANGWARRWVPGLDFALARARNAPPLPRVRAPAVVVPPPVESRLLAGWDRFWNRKYRALDADTRAQRFKRRPEVSTNHFEDFQGKVIAAYTERCRDAGVEP
jgi:hypothetical protein